MINQSLTQKTSQSLVLSKQMQQSLKILQMPTNELKAHVENELEQNPFLEVSEEVKTDKPDSEPKDNEQADSNPNQWQEESYLRYEKHYQASTGADEIFENLSTENISLKEYLIEQIYLEIPEGKERFIALYFTDILDDNGYLTESISVACDNLQCEKADVINTLNKLYKLDPVGVYAADLKDCMRIQLEDKGILTPQMESLLDNLDLLATGELKALCKKCDIALNDLPEIVETIKKLDPKPGRNFGADLARTAIPDAFVTQDKKGDFSVTLNTNSLPRLLVNSKYFQNILSSTKSAREKKFCNEKLQDANWLIRAMGQRAETIFKVSSQIVSDQYEFFEKGVNYLKPMTLSDIAKKVNLHESTISRIGNKIISTPTGNFEIRFFFNNALSSNISENMISSLAVKNKIKEMIDSESPKMILADDRIALTLNDEGINISRRTVAKYRDAMQIPPSNQRKRLKSVANL